MKGRSREENKIFSYPSLFYKWNAVDWLRLCGSSTIGTLASEYRFLFNEFYHLFLKAFKIRFVLFKSAFTLAVKFEMGHGLHEKFANVKAVMQSCVRTGVPNQRLPERELWRNSRECENNTDWGVHLFRKKSNLHMQVLTDDYVFS